MNESINKSTTKSLVYDIIIKVILLLGGGLIAFFMYGLDIIKAFGFIAYVFVWILITYATMIPFVGIIIYIFGLVFWNLPLMTLFTISPTWLTTLAVILLSIVPLIMYVVFTALVIYLIYSIIKK